MNKVWMLCELLDRASEHMDTLDWLLSAAERGDREAVVRAKNYAKYVDENITRALDIADKLEAELS